MVRHPVRRVVLAWRSATGDHQHRAVGTGSGGVPGHIVAYQQYLINHEIGHALNFDHVACSTEGDLAPVMMQQTWGTSNNYLASIGTDRVTADGKNCLVNPWPFPRSG